LEQEYVSTAGETRELGLKVFGVGGRRVFLMDVHIVDKLVVQEFGELGLLRPSANLLGLG
jgi:hypothetical protein